MVAVVCRSNVPMGLDRVGLCLRVDDKGTPYLVTQDGNLLAGVKRFSVHFDLNDVLRIEIHEILAAPPDQRR